MLSVFASRLRRRALTLAQSWRVGGQDQRGQRIGPRPRAHEDHARRLPEHRAPEADAKAHLTKLGEFSDPAAALKVLSKWVGHDLLSCPLDSPVPALPQSTIIQGDAVPPRLSPGSTT